MNDSPLTELIQIVENMVGRPITTEELEELYNYLLGVQLGVAKKCEETALRVLNKTT